MAAHTQAQKEFIVRRLAAFEPPRAIVTSFVATFRDTACTENDVLAVDPATQAVAPELHALFLAERERVLLDPKSAPFADQRARLIALSADAAFYAMNNQLGERRAVFRQIAEELGVVGGKGSSKAAPASSQPGDALPIVAIKRTIVDPAAASE